MSDDIILNKQKVDTSLLLIVYSSRFGGKYQCHRFREYNIDLDLETDSDAFDFVFKNPNSIYTGLFSKYDKVEIWINNVGIMKGTVDSAEYHWDSSDSYIRVVGRDMVAPLIDNDVLPTTLQNIKPHEYISKVCNSYNITNLKLDTTMSSITKLVLNVGESEMSVINTMAKNERRKAWLDYDTFHTGTWSKDVAPSFTFTRGVPVDKMCIPIKSFTYKEDGTTVPSEYIIYGNSSSNGSTNSVMGKAQNDYMVNNGIKRRLTENANSDITTKDSTSNAQDTIREKFDNSYTAEMVIASHNYAIKPNTTVWVIDMETRTNAIFFVKKVTYSKSIESGTEIKLSMIPSKAACDALFNGQGTKMNGGIVGYQQMTFDDLWNNKKG